MWFKIRRSRLIGGQAKDGFVAISTVLVISAVVIAISTTIALLAIGEAQASLAQYKGESALHFVEGCMEDALLKARASAAYTSGSITRPEGTCTITVAKAGTTWTITATTTATDYRRTVQAVINRTTKISLTSWLEI